MILLSAVINFLFISTNNIMYCIYVFIFFYFCFIFFLNLIPFIWLVSPFPIIFWYDGIKGMEWNVWSDHLTAEVEVEISAQVDSQNINLDVYDDKATPKHLYICPCFSFPCSAQLRPSMQHLKQPKKQVLQSLLDLFKTHATSSILTDLISECEKNSTIVLCSEWLFCIPLHLELFFHQLFFMLLKL